MNNWKYCTPEQGKRLAELGIKAGELMHYKKFDYNDETFVWSSKLQGATKEPAIAPAFDVAELGVMLATKIYRIEARHNPELEFLTLESGLRGAHFYVHGSEARARAQLLIYLLENNHVTAAECNARLKALNL